MLQNPQWKKLASLIPQTQTSSLRFLQHNPINVGSEVSLTVCREILDVIRYTLSRE